MIQVSNQTRSNSTCNIAQERLDDELNNYFSKANPVEEDAAAKEAPKEDAKVEEVKDV